MNSTYNLDKIYNKLPKEKIELKGEKVELEKVELGIADDIKRALNSLKSDLQINKESIKESNQFFNSLKSLIPKSKQRIKSNNNIIKSSKKKIDLAETTLQKAKKIAKDLGVNINEIKGYDEVTKSLDDIKETSGNIINFTVRLENLLK